MREISLSRNKYDSTGVKKEQPCEKNWSLHKLMETDKRIIIPLYACQSFIVYILTNTYTACAVDNMLQYLIFPQNCLHK